MNEMTNFVGNTDLKVGVRLNQKHLKRRVALRKIHAHILSQLEGWSAQNILQSVISKLVSLGGVSEFRNISKIPIRLQKLYRVSNINIFKFQQQIENYCLEQDFCPGLISSSPLSS